MIADFSVIKYCQDSKFQKEHECRTRPHCQVGYSDSDSCLHNFVLHCKMTNVSGTVRYSITVG